MAAIGSIRKQSGLLIILIGMAMVLFLLGDLFSSGTNFFTDQDQDVGEIAGEPISLQEFEVKVQEAIDQQYGAEGANEQARKSIRERIWQQFIVERVLDKEFASLGLSVGADELLDNVKNVQPGSILYQYFTDPQTGQVIEQFRDPQTGGLNSARVLQAIQNLINSENSRDWLPIEAALKQDVIQRKYAALLGKGLAISGVEAKQKNQEDNTKLAMSYVVKEYMSIPEEDIDITDADYQTYFNAHKNEERFQVTEEIRNIRMVEFVVNPTPEDLEEINLELIELKEDFKADSNDTAFVAENGESPVDLLIRYVREEELDPAIKDSVVNAEIGSTFGPFLSLGRNQLSKLIGIKSTPDSVKASHILISIQDPADTVAVANAKNLLDSLKAVAEKKNNFAELAEEYSEDFGSAQKGGDLDWFTKGRMVAPFEKAAFEGKVGDLPIIESQFGVHLIKITDQTDPKKNYLMATVDRALEPSKSTSDEIYKIASKFSIEHQTLESFLAAENVDILPPASVTLKDEGISGYPNSSDAKRWVFEASAGDVSNPFESENRFMIIALEQVSEEGDMTLDAAKPMIQEEVKNELKANLIIKELGSVSSPEEAAKSWGVDMQKLDDVAFGSGSIGGGLGRENKLIGTAFGMADGEVSPPIEGSRGVYVIRVDGRTTVDEEVDLAAVKRDQASAMSSRVRSAFFKALQDEVGVQDNRTRFY